MTEYEFHPICLEYRLFEDDAFEKLKRSIRTDGLDLPITLYRGVILDGRNRYLACRAVGVEPRFDDYTGNDPRSFVERRNDRRRHESDWVRADRAAKKANAPEGKPSETSSQELVTQEQAAAEVGVSVATLKRAKKIIESGISELIETLDSGEIGIREADAIARLPQEKQPVAIKKALAPKPIRADTSGNDEWYTPAKYIDMAREVMGGIDVDPAGCDISQKVIKAPTVYTIEDSGLEHSWIGKVWLNPPYSKGLIDLFVAKTCEEYEAGNATEIVVLTHNFTDTGWFHKLVAHSDCWCGTRGRIKFYTEDGVGNSPTSGHVFFYFGPNVKKFKEVFSEIGFVVRNA